MLRRILKAKNCLPIVAICVSSCAITGCVESSFTLANDSRLPRSMTIPHGLTRKDVSVTLNFYAPLRGPDSKFILANRKGKKLAEVKGNTKRPTYTKEHRPIVVTQNGTTNTIDMVALIPNGEQDGYEHIVTENGITETILLRPCTRDVCIIQNGRVVALFYFIDNIAAGKKIVKEGLPKCPNDNWKQIELSQSGGGGPCLITLE
jgi:hypothetical protein